MPQKKAPRLNLNKRSKPSAVRAATKRLYTPTKLYIWPNTGGPVVVGQGQAITIPKLEEAFLQSCSRLLKLTKRATKLYDAESGQMVRFADLTPDREYVVTCGERLDRPIGNAGYYVTGFRTKAVMPVADWLDRHGLTAKGLTLDQALKGVIFAHGTTHYMMDGQKHVVNAGYCRAAGGHDKCLFEHYIMPDGSACHVLPGMATKLLNKLPRMRKSLTEAIATYHELLVATSAVAESMAAETALCTILGAMEEKCPVILVDCSNKMSALAINQMRKCSAELLDKCASHLGGPLRRFQLMTFAGDCYASPGVGACAVDQTGFPVIESTPEEIARAKKWLWRLKPAGSGGLARMVARVASAECVDGIFVITDGFVGEKEYKKTRDSVKISISKRTSSDAKKLALRRAALASEFYNNKKRRDAEKAQRKAVAAAQKAARQELTRSTDAYHVPDDEPAAAEAEEEEVEAEPEKPDDPIPPPPLLLHTVAIEADNRSKGWLDRLARVGGGHGYAYSTGKSEKHIEEAGIDIESFEPERDVQLVTEEHATAETEAEQLACLETALHQQLDRVVWGTNVIKKELGKGASDVEALMAALDVVYAQKECSSPFQIASPPISPPDNWVRTSASQSPGQLLHQIRSMYQLLDQPRQGYLSRVELAGVLDIIEESWPADQATRVLASAPSQMTFRHFLAFIKVFFDAIFHQLNRSSERTDVLSAADALPVSLTLKRCHAVSMQKFGGEQEGVVPREQFPEFVITYGLGGIGLRALRHALGSLAVLGCGPPTAGAQHAWGSTLRETFDRTDDNGDGSLTRSEIVRALRSDPEVRQLLGLGPPENTDVNSEFEISCRGIDGLMADEGAVSYEDFVKLAVQHGGAEWQANRLEETFTLIEQREEERRLSLAIGRANEAATLDADQAFDIGMQNNFNAPAAVVMDFSFDNDDVPKRKPPVLDRRSHMNRKLRTPSPMAVASPAQLRIQIEDNEKRATRDKKNTAWVEESLRESAASPADACPACEGADWLPHSEGCPKAPLTEIEEPKGGADASMPITVDIISCQGLKDLETFSVSDPYVKVKLGDQEFKTVARDGNLSPVFNEKARFMVPVEQLESSVLRLEVWDDNCISDDEMGFYTTQLSAAKAVTDSSGAQTVNLSVGEGQLTFAVTYDSIGLDKQQVEQDATRKAEAQSKPKSAKRIAWADADKTKSQKFV